MFHKHCIHKLKIFEKMFKIIVFRKQNFIVGNSALWDHVETYKLLHLRLGMLNPCLHGHLQTQQVAHTPVLKKWKLRDIILVQCMLPILIHILTSAIVPECLPVKIRINL